MHLKKAKQANTKKTLTLDTCENKGLLKTA